MDREDELLKILGKLGRGKIEDVADRIIAFFRQPAWWEEEFDKQFVARESRAVFEDFDTRDAVKSFISTLLTRAQQDTREEMVKMVTDLKAGIIVSTTPHVHPPVSPVESCRVITIRVMSS